MASTSAKLLLLGDALVMSYRERLAAILSEDGVEVVGPAEPAGDVRRLVDLVDGVLSEYAPDMACFACGQYPAEVLVGAAADRPPEPIPFAEYESGLLWVTGRLVRWCGRQTVFVTAPPLHAGRFAAARGGEQAAQDLGETVNRSINAANELAEGLLGQMNVMVADLHRELARGADEAFGADGVLLSPAGVELAAGTVAKGVYSIMHA